MSLREEGRPQEALEQIAAHAGLEAEDLSEPERIDAKLRALLAPVPLPLALSYRDTLASLLMEAGLRDVAVFLLERAVGLEAADFGESPRLAAKLRGSLRGLPGDPAVFFVFRLANFLELADRHEDQLVVLEAWAGLGPDDLADRDRLRRQIDDALRGASPDLRALFCAMLANSLGKMGREAESVAFIEASFGITEPSDVLPVLASLDPSTKFSLLLGYCTNLGFLGQEDRALAILENATGLRSGDYADQSLLASKMDVQLQGLMIEMRFSLVRAFVDTLLLLKRGDDCLNLLAAAAHLFTAQGRLPEVARQYVVTWAQALYQADRTAEAAALLASDLGLGTEDWLDPETVSSRVADHFAGMPASLADQFVMLLAATLDESDQEDRAALLVDVYLRRLGAIAATVEENLLRGWALCQIATYWLVFWGRDESRHPWSFCETLVSALRPLLARWGSHLQEREELLRSVADLRWRLVQAGLYWARRETDPERARERRRTVHLWDLELGQRLLVERFLLTEIRPAPAGKAPRPGVWPLTEPRPRSAGHLPDRTVSSAAVGVLGTIVTAPLPAAQGKGSAALKSERPWLYQKLEALVHGGLDEPALAAALGRHGLLLRGAFDFEGRLIWAVLAGEGDHLALVEFGTGEPGDLAALRWATARHDFALGYIHWCRSLRPVPVLLDQARSALREAILALAESAGSPSPKDVSEIAVALGRKLEHNPAALAAGHLFAFLLRPFQSIRSEAEQRSAAAELRAIEGLVAGEERDWSRAALDRETADYLRRAGAVWDLAPIADLLTPEIDVTFQVDDALHAVPVAFLSVGEEPLYRRVRSVGGSLAPLLDTLQREMEEEAGGGAARRLLSISSFAPGDPARDGALWLHHGQLGLADEHGAECLADAGRDGGLVGAIRAALERYVSFTTAAICGHGDFERAGIALADDTGHPVLWQGDGCDLKSVEWLLLVSCSIGRTKGDGDLDVEGFCVQLAAHHARSVLACRWPVLAVEAAAFANEATHRYLVLREQTGGGPAGLRALTLARVRRDLAVDPGSPIGLNTAAAFELYGLG